MSKIKEFYKTDGLDYKYRRWEQYPTGVFDFNCTKKAISDFLSTIDSKYSLEVGCGPGTWTEMLKSRSKKLLAVDISDTMISEARKNIEDQNIIFLNQDITEYRTNENFDLVFSIRAFEYFPEKGKFIKKCSEMLNDDGQIFIITKTKISYWYGRSKIRNILKRLLPFIFYYENQEMTKNKIENLSNFQQERLSTTEFKNLLLENGFSNIVIKPVIIRPPIFMRGKTEIPLIPPILEKPILFFLKYVDKILSNFSVFTIFAESYSITGTKK